MFYKLQILLWVYFWMIKQIKKTFAFMWLYSLAKTKTVHSYTVQDVMSSYFNSDYRMNREYILICFIRHHIRMHSVRKVSSTQSTRLKRKQLKRPCCVTSELQRNDQCVLRIKQVNAFGCKRNKFIRLVSKYSNHLIVPSNRIIQ
jgi:hypothetical protein